MSAFQDFGLVSERRRAERQHTRRRRLIIAGGSIFVILILAAACFAAVQYSSKQGHGGASSSHKSSSGHTSASRTSTSPSGSAKTELHTIAKYIDLICALTDYKEACNASLTKFANATSPPKDLIKAAVSAVGDEIAQAFGKLDLVKEDDPKVQGAVEDCKEVHGYAKDELASTLSSIDAIRLDQLPKIGHDLKNWMSAVITYQETCIDGFPEGELKSKMRDSMKAAKELTSNSLAIIENTPTFLPSMTGVRHLLAEEPAVNKNGFPSWISYKDRRMLQSRNTKGMTPNVTVAKDGSGDFTTINDALAKLPAKYEGRYVIYIKEGVYNETVIVTAKMENITMYGDGSRKTIVTGSKNFVDGTRTFQTATFAAIGNGFMAIAMGFRNTAGAIKHQAVALRVQSDRSIFLNCRMDGYQDTLYAHAHRQFYRSCIITGTIDFIFGDAAAMFQNCVLTVRRPLDNQQNIITAQGRADRHESSGFVIQKCRIVADDDLVPDKLKFRSYLGRPWKEFSRTVFMENEIDDFIQPEGYMPWEGDFALKTLFYAEYKNSGPGASTNARVKWPGFKVVTNQDEALGYTTEVFINGKDWISDTDTPVRLGLFN